MCSFRRSLRLVVACCGLFVCSASAPLCPCPDDKWQPPFRPSQVLYSEFPEDRGRSLNLADRRDGLKGRRFPSSQYEPTSNNRFPEEPPKDYARDYAEADYNTGGNESPIKDYGSFEGRNTDYVENQDYSQDYADIEYKSSDKGEPSKEHSNYAGPNEGYLNADREEPSKNYDDVDVPNQQYSGHKDYSDYKEQNYLDEPSPALVGSSENSVEYYKKYDEYGDYKQEKVLQEEEELAGYSPKNVNQEEIESTTPTSYDENNSSYQQTSWLNSHRESTKSTEHPTTQSEVPGTLPNYVKLSTPIPSQSNGYSFSRTPTSVGLPTPRSRPSWSRWKNALDQVELSNLQVMKPPPLGQAQTWSRILSTNYLPQSGSGSGINGQLYGKRSTIRYS